ncbi:MAG TPA: Uma2 family endonuclease [Chloroflexota bacterium]|nr:Uma2 family endonuclease [Chloroflexota bacterium]
MIEAAMATATALMTAEEFLLMPKGVNKHELVNGEVIELSPVGRPHGRTQARFCMFIGPHVESDRLGEVFVEVGFTLARNPDVVRAPDVSFVSEEQLLRTPLEPGFFAGYPDIAVEVVSPGDTIREIEDKVQAYFDAGTRLVWLAYSDRRRVMVRYPDGRGLMLSGDDVLPGEDVMPGFSVTINDLFGK